MDQIISDCASTHLTDPKNILYMQDDVILGTSSFEYRKFREMLMRVVGLIGIEKIERNYDLQKFDVMRSTLGTLRKYRDNAAHTHVSGATQVNYLLALHNLQGIRSSVHWIGRPRSVCQEPNSLVGSLVNSKQRKTPPHQRGAFPRLWSATASLRPGANPTAPSPPQSLPPGCTGTIPPGPATAIPAAPPAHGRPSRSACGGSRPPSRTPNYCAPVSRRILAACSAVSGTNPVAPSCACDASSSRRYALASSIPSRTSSIAIQSS